MLATQLTYFDISCIVRFLDANTSLSLLLVLPFAATRVNICGQR